MDFTQIMQRYTRLRERYEQGEIDADSFEQQVNGMIYKDEQGRYWQIGVQTGLWYYYDGTKWVQDDLVDESAEEEEPEEPEIEMAAIDEIFPMEEAEPGSELSPFDMAFEEQLASQFANSGNSQIFDVFDDTDIFASILKGKGIDAADDPLAAPAEEVEGLAEHLEATQPVSIETLMGEGTAISVEDAQGDIDFLFEDSEDSEYPEVKEGSQMDLTAVLGSTDQTEEVVPDEIKEPPVPETDVRDVAERDVVTGELHLPVEPLTKDALEALRSESGKLQQSRLEAFERNAEPFDFAVEDDFVDDEEKDPLDWKLEPNEFSSSRVEETDLPKSPMLEILDDEFSLDELVADSEQEYLEETQAVPVGAAAEYYDDTDEEEDFFGPGDSAPFELPAHPESQQMNTVPNGVSNPAGETMQAARQIRPRRKLPSWVVVLMIFVGVFGVALLVLLGLSLFSSFDTAEIPIVNNIIGESASKIDADDPRFILSDSFDGNTANDWTGIEDQSIGFADYYQGFYYIYSMVPEVPTIATAGLYINDVVIDIRTTQLNDKYPDTLSTYGVMCRVQENGDGYSFRITNNGQYVIEKYVNGIFIPLNNWSYSEVIKANKDINKNHIVAECVGTQLSLSVNGHLLDVAVDSTFTEGKIGFVAQAGATGAYTEVHFDELLLTRPE
ncbi:MAG: hypothetical protein V2J07_10570 [Anaerolineae bacterium]|jgi:hypothetical protein|nr:hypothetical protein [Anaerolineae bacterium]